MHIQRLFKRNVYIKMFVGTQMLNHKIKDKHIYRQICHAKKIKNNITQIYVTKEKINKTNLIKSSKTLPDIEN